ncbi:MAG: glutaredoxin 3 [Pelagibacterales bacterium]|nr:glutaredoxin 3 [Pelagibacterales bacterium]PPR17210.1 MAG: Glutaredoxin-3 [Alphaproteobacteria bacterium MarineAlpha9_Bin3]|tara:strand:- start:115 stop:381 length:267 start_codon:yes stop_codon:yes gene_type:complete
MRKMLIYTGYLCGYCSRAKSLLKENNIDFDEINIHDNPEKMEEMLKLSGGKRSVPQIFYGNIHIGGSDDLYAMSVKGKLDKLINEENK